MIEQASLVIGEGNWAVKSDSLLGYKINGGKYYPREMSVVRATTGTRINEDGLVELVPYNLLNYSSSFDNAAWTKSNGNGGSAPIVTANYGISPDGTQNAYRIQLTRTSVYGSYSWVYQQFTATIGQSYTWSVWLKSLSGTPSVALTNDGVSFANIVTLTNQWERYEFTTNAIATPCNAMFLLYELIPSTSLTADFLAYGFQAVEGSSALDYLPTTDRLDVARIDYSSGSGALLVEPQRTNLAFPSQNITALFPSGMTNTANQTISPDGTQNAGKSTIGTGTAFRDVTTSPTVTTVSGTTYTTSFFAKKGTGIESIYFYQGDGNRIAKFNLNNGSYIGNAPSNGYSAFTSYSSQSYENGWYRFTATYTAASTIGQFTIGISTNTNDTVTPIAGNGTDFVYVWGLQYEAGNYSTSYIPTQGSTVTRNADVISKTGIADLIGQTEGTVFMQVGKIQTPQSVLQLFGIDNGTSAQRIEIGVSTSNQIFIYAETTSGSVFQLNIGTLIDNSKIAVAYKANQWAVYLNGTSIYTNTSANYVPTCSALRIVGRYDNAGIEKANVKSAALYKTRLTNAELASLTSL